ncbi:recombination regulator RecX, partial [Candidatus Microgenomates bacterium]|nr:recombination regulator RecX [Candidatus Microgenomates bacterium]
MKITAIRQQQKRQQRYSIYVDNKYAFSLSESELVKLGLRKDQEVTKAQVAGLEKQAKLDKAYDRTLRYLNIRPRSQFEVTDYLKRKGYGDQVIH